MKHKLFSSNCQLTILARERIISWIFYLFAYIFCKYFLVFSLIKWAFYKSIIYGILVYLLGLKIHRARSTNSWFSQKVSAHKKAVLITGCDTGFGFETAKRLSKSRFHVFAGCLDPDTNGGQELQNHPGITVIKMDVSKMEDIEYALDMVTQKLGDSDLWAVINNAGIPGGTQLQVTSMQEIEKVLDVNLLGTIRVSKVFLPLLKKSKGRIINVASAAGRLRMAGFIGYGTSKSAIIAFSDVLRLEVQKHGMSVVTIEPWTYKTRLAKPSGLSRLIKKQWSESGVNNKDEEYVDKLQSKTSDLFAKIVNPNISEVTDVMEDAVVQCCPPYYYRPGSWYFNLMLWILNLIPQPVADYVQWDFIFKC